MGKVSSSLINTDMAVRLLLIALVACTEALVLSTGASRTPARLARQPAVNMVVEPSSLDSSSLDAASQLLALSIPIPEYSPGKAFLMMASNIFVICTMSIQGKSLARGTSHDEMVESFGITWLLAGTSLGHIVGAGAILGVSSLGVF